MRTVRRSSMIDLFREWSTKPNTVKPTREAPSSIQELMQMWVKMITESPTVEDNPVLIDVEDPNWKSEPEKIEYVIEFQYPKEERTDV